MQLQLNDDEWLVLDGKCRPEVQSLVNDAIQRRAWAAEMPLSAKELQFLTKVRQVAIKELRLTYAETRIESCYICGKRCEYRTYPRTTKSHRKGDKDYSSPITFLGIDLDRGFVSVRGHTSCGGCDECIKKLKPYILKAIGDLRLELPDALRGEAPKLKRTPRKTCKDCGWTGNESQMGKLPALMGGYYPGKCPSCGAENNIFMAAKIETVDGYDLIEVRA